MNEGYYATEPVSASLKVRQWLNIQAVPTFIDRFIINGASAHAFEPQKATDLRSLTGFELTLKAPRKYWELVVGNSAICPTGWLAERPTYCYPKAWFRRRRKARRPS